MRVLIADKVEIECVEGLRGVGCEVELRPDADGDSLRAAIAETTPEALVVRSTKVPGSILSEAPSLKLVVRAGSGYDNIDTETAAATGIAVCNTPGMNAVAVAELTLGHLISLDRHLPEQDAELKAGRWNKKRFSRARGLKGRSLLVIGTGAIGIEVINRAIAFGMDVHAQSRSLTEEMARAIGVGWVPYTREDLLAALPRFDAVTVHVPSTPDSVGMCNADFFGALREGAYFINTSRGDIVDEHALADAVRAGRITAALDVYQGQPAAKETDWRPEIASLPGVHCTHHCGASTDQAQLAVAEEVVRIVRVFKETRRFEHCVNGVG